MEADRRLLTLERSCADLPLLPPRVAAMERFCSDQTEQNVVADDWGRTMERHVGELEQRADDIELIRFTKIRDERDDRVEALENAHQVLDEWRPWVEASIYDIRREIRRSSNPDLRSAQHGAVRIFESASARPSAGEKVDWPSWHCEQGYGSVTTIAPPLNHGMNSSRPLLFFPV